MPRHKPSVADWNLFYAADNTPWDMGRAHPELVTDLVEYVGVAPRVVDRVRDDVVERRDGPPAVRVALDLAGQDRQLVSGRATRSLHRSASRRLDERDVGHRSRDQDEGDRRLHIGNLAYPSSSVCL